MMRHKKRSVVAAITLCLSLVCAALPFGRESTNFAGGPFHQPRACSWRRNCRLSRRAVAETYSGKTVQELKEILKERGLTSTGKKAVLIERLVDHDKQAESGKAVPPPPPAREAVPARSPSEAAPAPAPSTAPQAPEELWIKMKPNVYLNEQGLTEDGRYMCLDGVARTGNWEAAKRDYPNDMRWLSEWVVAARTGQLKKGKPGGQPAGKR